MNRFPVAPDFRPADMLVVLARHGVRFVIIGGVAAFLHGSDQVTMDLDLAHERTEENVARLVAALRELGARRVTDPDFPEPPGPGTFDHRIEHFVCPFGNLDVFNEVRRVGGYERIAPSAVPFEIAPGVVVLIADIDTLILSKAGTDRPKDPNHIRSLERVKEERARRGLDGGA